MNSGYSPELMDSVRAYAASLRPTPGPEYEVLHDYIRVPAGHLPIRIVQFSDANNPAENWFCHWAIFIPTSTRRGVGNFYEVVGNLQTGYGIQRVLNGRHPRWDKDERGSHLVGWVAPTYLETLERHLFEVPIRTGSLNRQFWVIDALGGSDQWHIMVHTVQMNYNRWIRQMKLVEEAWMIGDA